MPINKSDILAQRIADDMVKSGSISNRSEAMRFGKRAITELRESFLKPPAQKNISPALQEVEKWKQAWNQSTKNWSSTNPKNKALGNAQFRVWLQQLRNSPRHVQDSKIIRRYKGIAERNTGFKGTAKPGTTPKQQGLQFNKNIDVTDLQRTKVLHAQQKQWSPKTSITSGLDPKNTPENIKTAKTASVPTSNAPSKQGPMLRKADLTNPAGVAEAKYEAKLMKTAMEGGQKAVKQQYRIDTKQKMPRSLWKKISKALENVRFGGAGFGKGGRSKANNQLRKGGANINDIINL